MWWGWRIVGGKKGLDLVSVQPGLANICLQFSLMLTEIWCQATVFTRIQENYARLEVRLSGGKTEQP